MKKLFQETKLVREAKEAQKGMFWLWEILVFIPVFLVCELSMLIIALPLQLVLLFTDSGYMNALQAADPALIMEASLRIAGSNAYMCGTLISQILMIVVCCLFCRLIQKRKLANVGFAKKGAFKEYLIGCGVGFAIFTVAVLGALATGALKVEGVLVNFSLGFFILFFIGFMFQGMAEEVICRGYFMVSVARRYPMALAIFLNSFVFAALHLTNSGIGVIPFINLCLFGVFASVYFIRRGSLWGVGAVHSVWNFVQGNFYGIKVSGMELNCSVFSMSAVEGKELLSGGAFGLEGSIFVTIVLVAGTLVMYFWKKADIAEYVIEEKQEAKQEVQTA